MDFDTILKEMEKERQKAFAIKKEAKKEAKSENREDKNNRDNKNNEDNKQGLIKKEPSKTPASQMISEPAVSEAATAQATTTLVVKPVPAKTVLREEVKMEAGATAKKLKKKAKAKYSKQLLLAKTNVIRKTAIRKAAIKEAPLKASKKFVHDITSLKEKLKNVSKKEKIFATKESVLKEIQKIKKDISYIMEFNPEVLIDSIRKLNLNLLELNSLFKLATEQMQRPDPIVEQMGHLFHQNEIIAKGILRIIDMVKKEGSEFKAGEERIEREIEEDIRLPLRRIAEEKEAPGMPAPPVEEAEFATGTESFETEPALPTPPPEFFEGEQFSGQFKSGRGAEPTPIVAPNVMPEAPSAEEKGYSEGNESEYRSFLTGAPVPGLKEEQPPFDIGIPPELGTFSEPKAAPRPVSRASPATAGHPSSFSFQPKFRKREEIRF